MWPWEHLAFGYLLLSVPHRALTRRPPGDRAVLALVVGTQFPDLVDKPLAWSLGVLPSGTSLAHSAFVAVPVVVLVLVVARRTGWADAGVGFAVGYLSHLVGDVLYPVMIGRAPGYGAVLWPLVGTAPSESVGLWTRFVDLFGNLLVYLATPAGVFYLVLEAALLGGALAVWLYDGAPGVGALWSSLGRPPTTDDP